MARKKQSKKPEIPSPEYLDRLLATPEHEVLVERLFAFFLEYPVQAELIGKQQNEQIMDFWKNSRETPSEEEPLVEKDESTIMGVDPQQSNLTRKRTEEAQYHEQKRSKSGAKRQRLECSKGCGHECSKAGQLNQHEQACHGKFCDLQKKEKAQESRLDPGCQSPRTAPRNHQSCWTFLGTRVILDTGFIQKHLLNEDKNREQPILIPHPISERSRTES